VQTMAFPAQYWASSIAGTTPLPRCKSPDSD